jgi:predicted TIM-barrel fold metal-dependent hydrolase
LRVIVGVGEAETLDVDERVDLMDRLGLDAQVLAVSIPFTYDGDATTRLRLARLSNDPLAQAAQDHPRRFFALATLPLHVEDSLTELERCFDDLGMIGVMLGSTVNGMRLENPVLAPIFDELDRRGTSVFLHPNVPVCSGPDVAELNISSTLAYIFDTSVTVYRMIFSGMLDRYRQLKVVVPHLGGILPYLSGRLEESYRSGRAGNALSKPPGEYLSELYYDTLINHQLSLRMAREQFGTRPLDARQRLPAGFRLARGRAWFCPERRSDGRGARARVGQKRRARAQSAWVRRALLFVLPIDTLANS